MHASHESTHRPSSFPVPRVGRRRRRTLFRASLSAPSLLARPLRLLFDRLQTLAPVPLHHWHRPELLAAADSPPSVSPSPIPRGSSFLSLSSFDFGPHPAPSPSAGPPRRAPSPAAAFLRRDAASSPFSARAVAGEVHRHRLNPVRASPGQLWPRLRRAVVRRRRRVARVAPRARAAPWACTCPGSRPSGLP